MGNFFFDSSALVKKYARESGTSWVLALFKPSVAHTLFIARITPVETVAGLAKQNRTGTLSADGLDKAVRRIKRSMMGRFAFVEITDEIVLEAIRLVRTHGLRGYDAVQLATAISIESNLAVSRLSPLVFVSADLNLNKAAVVEGLTVDDPNNH